MQIAQSGISQNVELHGRLNVGGRWYGRAQVVSVDRADAEVLLSRGLVSKAKPGAKPVNVEILKPQQVETQTKDPDKKETVPLEYVGHQLKDKPKDTAPTKEQDYAQRSAKKR